MGFASDTLNGPYKYCQFVEMPEPQGLNDPGGPGSNCDSWPGDLIQSTDGSLFFVNGWGNIYKAAPGTLDFRRLPGNTTIARSARVPPFLPPSVSLSSLCVSLCVSLSLCLSFPPSFFSLSPPLSRSLPMCMLLSLIGSPFVLVPLLVYTSHTHMYHIRRPTPAGSFDDLHQIEFTFLPPGTSGGQCRSSSPSCHLVPVVVSTDVQGAGTRAGITLGGSTGRVMHARYFRLFALILPMHARTHARTHTHTHTRARAHMHPDRVLRVPLNYRSLVALPCLVQLG